MYLLSDAPILKYNSQLLPLENSLTKLRKNRLTFFIKIPLLAKLNHSYILETKISASYTYESCLDTQREQ